ncbi:hypothetical protein D3C85_1826480 [compost metagenome]
MLEVVAIVEHVVDLRIGQSHGRIGLEVLRKQPGAVAAMFPDLHGIALHRRIGVFAAIAGLRQRQQHAL